MREKLLDAWDDWMHKTSVGPADVSHLIEGISIGQKLLELGCFVSRDGVNLKEKVEQLYRLRTKIKEERGR